MATYTGSLSNSPYIYVDTTVTELEPDIINNRTKVNVLVQLRSSSSQSYDAYGTGSLTVYIDGSEAGSASGSALNFNFANYSVKDLLSFDAWVPHNPDGTKTANFRTYIRYPSGKPHGSSDTNANIPLTTIPRGSVLGTIPNFTVDANEDIGVDISVPQTTYSSSFYNVLSVHIGSTLIATFEDYKQQKIKFSIAQLQTVYTEMQNVNEIEFTFRLTTYENANKTTQIGNTSEKKATGALSTNGLNPTFLDTSIGYKDVNSATVALTGNNQAIIAGVSNVQMEITTKATANKHATLGANAYLFEIGSMPTQSANQDDALPIQKTFNSVTVSSGKITATDSRGNKTSQILTWSQFIAYEVPVITDIRLKRDNDVDDTTKISFSGHIWPGDFGAAVNSIQAISYKYKETTSESWTSGTTDISAVTYDTATGEFEFAATYIDGDLGSGGFAAQKSYNIQVIVTDKLTSGSGTETLNVGVPGLFMKKFYTEDTPPIFKGYGLGVGQKPPDIGVYYLGQLLAKEADLESLQIISGSNANGTYIKFPDGTMECYGTKLIPSVSFSSVNAVYYALLPTIAFAATFYNVPIVVSSVEMGNVGATQVSGISTTDFTGAIISASSATFDVTIRFIAKGRWRA